jgi:uncharacterized membrane protein
MSQQEDVPLGWDYNPSEWSRRLPIIGLACLGFGISAYLALYQLGAFADVFEPFFGDGSIEVLDSEISHVFPIPDAALGAAVYLFDVITGSLGGTRRWKSSPWIVLAFGLAVGPLGAVSVLLVILQPVALGAWCTLCLASAVVSVLMIGPAMDEVLAALQQVRRLQGRGASLLEALLGREPGPASLAETRA